MKRESALLVILLLGISAGCGKQKKKQDLGAEKNPEITQKVADNSNIPLAQDQVRSFFDDDLGEFELVDNSTEANQEVKPVVPMEEQEELADEFAWVETDQQGENSLQVVYFDFDRYVVQAAENDKIVHDAQVLKDLISKQEKNNGKVTIIAEGHSCHAKGSRIYNLALSEKRAKEVADRLVSLGFSRDQIKIVGRGKEFPAIIDGKPVTGSIEEQWPNRRVEISIISA